MAVTVKQIIGLTLIWNKVELRESVGDGERVLIPATKDIVYDDYADETVRYITPSGSTLIICI